MITTLRHVPVSAMIEVEVAMLYREELLAQVVRTTTGLSGDGGYFAGALASLQAAMRDLAIPARFDAAGNPLAQERAA